VPNYSSFVSSEVHSNRTPRGFLRLWIGRQSSSPPGIHAIHNNASVPENLAHPVILKSFSLSLSISYPLSNTKCTIHLSLTVPIGQRMNPSSNACPTMSRSTYTYPLYINRIGLYSVEQRSPVGNVIACVVSSDWTHRRTCCSMTSPTRNA